MSSLHTLKKLCSSLPFIHNECNISLDLRIVSSRDPLLFSDVTVTNAKLSKDLKCRNLDRSYSLGNRAVRSALHYIFLIVKGQVELGGFLYY